MSKKLISFGMAMLVCLLMAMPVWSAEVYYLGGGGGTGTAGQMNPAFSFPQRVKDLFLNSTLKCNT
jgi:hypothetical protein